MISRCFNMIDRAMSRWFRRPYIPRPAPPPSFPGASVTAPLGNPSSSGLLGIGLGRDRLGLKKTPVHLLLPSDSAPVHLTKDAPLDFGTIVEGETEIAVSREHINPEAIGRNCRNPLTAMRVPLITLK